jgi:hypothetical protein
MRRTCRQAERRSCSARVGVYWGQCCVLSSSHETRTQTRQTDTHTLCVCVWQVEEMYERTNQSKVALWSYSFGPETTLSFLHRMTQEWKDKYISWYVCVCMCVRVCACACVLAFTLMT